MIRGETLTDSAKAAQFSRLLVHPEISLVFDVLMEIDFLTVQTYPADLEASLYLSYGLKKDYYLMAEIQDPDHR